MSHVFTHHGNQFRQAHKDSLRAHEKLPAGVYLVKNDQHGIFLEQVENFKTVAKHYGNATRFANRIWNTFESRESNTGVLLTGEKGSGKTLLAKTISKMALEKDIPTLLVNQDFHADDFSVFLQNINQPVVVLFDEFEKNFTQGAQESLLTLFDGVFSQKKLFLLTCNDKYSINSHFQNRPGRIFYMIEYKGLEDVFVKEYCEDNLVKKEHMQGVVEISRLFESFNFDMLKSLVEEMNRYQETAKQALEMLNIKIQPRSAVYEVSIVDNGLVIHKDNIDQHRWHGDVLSEEIDLSWMPSEKDMEWDHEKTRDLCVSPQDLVKMDWKKFHHVYEKDGVVITLIQKEDKRVSVMDLVS